ncbi:methyltransferase domain-containing protein [Arthrobacter sp. LAPM80]|uniref:methyltransferase domain-containing protein n=1 Tax=Arthrobacter sp. LAPM80 TaxID=3141788 RepID=UPI00398A8DBA
MGDQSVDAIICLQAWHWVDPEQATNECDRVLKHNGMMGMAWNTWDRTSNWVQALAAIVEPDGTPADQTLSAPDELAGRGAFERNECPLNYELTVDHLVQLASSWALVAQRPDRNVVLAKIRGLGEFPGRSCPDPAARKSPDRHGFRGCHGSWTHPPAPRRRPSSHCWSRRRACGRAGSPLLGSSRRDTGPFPASAPGACHRKNSRGP